MVQIIPAILATTEEDFVKDLQKFKDSSSFEDGWIHIDFMDNKFVQNQGIDPEILKNIEIPFKKEAHLMVEKPWKWINKLKETNFQRVIIHIEADDEAGIKEALDLAEDYGMETGIALNPQTPLEKIKPHLYDINLVLIMGVTPGFQGQEFNPSTYDRVREGRSLFATIEVDGGVTDQTAGKLVESGASILISGSYLLKAEDLEENLEKLWEVINK